MLLGSIAANEALSNKGRKYRVLIAGSGTHRKGAQVLIGGEGMSGVQWRLFLVNAAPGNGEVGYLGCAFEVMATYI